MYVAGDSGSASLDGYARPGDSTFFGGTYPAQTWAQYMQAASEGQAVKQFDPPAYVNSNTAPQPSRTYQAPQPSQQPTTSQQPSRQPSQSTSSEPEPSDEPSDQPSRRPSASSSASGGTGGAEGEAEGDTQPGGDASGGG